MYTAIMVLIVMAAVGLIFGFILATANEKFSMEANGKKICYTVDIPFYESKMNVAN